MVSSQNVLLMMEIMFKSRRPGFKLEKTVYKEELICMLMRTWIFMHVVSLKPYDIRPG